MLTPADWLKKSRNGWLTNEKEGHVGMVTKSGRPITEEDYWQVIMLTSSSGEIVVVGRGLIGFKLVYKLELEVFSVNLAPVTTTRGGFILENLPREFSGARNKFKFNFSVQNIVRRIAKSSVRVTDFLINHILNNNTKNINNSNDKIMANNNKNYSYNNNNTNITIANSSYDHIDTDNINNSMNGNNTSNKNVTDNNYATGNDLDFININFGDINSPNTNAVDIDFFSRIIEGDDINNINDISDNNDGENVTFNNNYSNNSNSSNNSSNNVKIVNNNNTNNNITDINTNSVTYNTTNTTSVNNIPSNTADINTYNNITSNNITNTYNITNNNSTDINTYNNIPNNNILNNTTDFNAYNNFSNNNTANANNITNTYNITNNNTNNGEVFNAYNSTTSNDINSTNNSANNNDANNAKTRLKKKYRTKQEALTLLIIEAINSCQQGLAVADIYSYISQKDSNYPASDQTWHQNVRFSLTHNKYFYKSNLSRSNGRGRLWLFDPVRYNQGKEEVKERRRQRMADLNQKVRGHQLSNRMDDSTSSEASSTFRSLSQVQSPSPATVTNYTAPVNKGSCISHNNTSQNTSDNGSNNNIGYNNIGYCNSNNFSNNTNNNNNNFSSTSNNTNNSNYNSINTNDSSSIGHIGNNIGNNTNYIRNSGNNVSNIGGDNTQLLTQTSCRNHNRNTNIGNTINLYQQQNVYPTNNYHSFNHLTPCATTNHFTTSRFSAATTRSAATLQGHCFDALEQTFDCNTPNYFPMATSSSSQAAFYNRQQYEQLQQQRRRLQQRPQHQPYLQYQRQQRWQPQRNMTSSTYDNQSTTMNSSDGYASYGNWNTTTTYARDVAPPQMNSATYLATSEPSGPPSNHMNSYSYNYPQPSQRYVTNQHQVLPDQDQFTQRSSSHPTFAGTSVKRPNTSMDTTTYPPNKRWCGPSQFYPDPDDFNNY
ncbi:hypothetical protein HELRODRAFT_171079 [Helobdella robusta]|uniref:Fork-head domain-containing protein n=1 Tax=Helobdella robusta TaxID=6412 RepID=T1F3S8_HELRO|nr:hypothetical protein HELRODRAFT_171079 [Helobdella robusta]ESO07036.1 hypothetical protein HELRODRAFT_171079 [Helobdella robusta]